MQWESNKIITNGHVVRLGSLQRKWKLLRPKLFLHQEPHRQPASCKSKQAKHWRSWEDRIQNHGHLSACLIVVLCMEIRPVVNSKPCLYSNLHPNREEVRHAEEQWPRDTDPVLELPADHPSIPSIVNNCLATESNKLAILFGFLPL